MRTGIKSTYMIAKIVIYLESDEQINNVINALNIKIPAEPGVSISAEIKENSQEADACAGNAITMADHGVTTKNHHHTCMHCGTDFLSNHKDTKYCSKSCSVKHYQATHPKYWEKRKRVKSVKKSDTISTEHEDKIEVQTVALKACKACGKKFHPEATAHRYCPDCRKKRDNNYSKKKETLAPVAMDGTMSLAEAMNPEIDKHMTDRDKKIKEARQRQKTQREVRIDNRTVIMVDASLSDEEARRQYFIKHPQ